MNNSVFENPKIKAILAAAKKKGQSDQENTSLVDLVPMQMGTTSPPVVLSEYREEKLDDGAKSRLKNDGNIVDLYTKWFNPEKVGNVTSNSCLVNCCNSSVHRDNDPSMDLAPVNNSFLCRGCDWQGDIVDLAAVSAGLISPGQKCPDDLIPEAVMHGCRSAFADMDMDSAWKQVGQKGTWIFDTTPPPSSVDYSNIEPPETAPKKYVAEIDWQATLPRGTGLFHHMEVMEKTRVPRAFRIPMWQIIVSSIIGNDLVYDNELLAVECNFYNCLVGPPSSGKSTALKLTKKLLTQSKYRRDINDRWSRGVEYIEDISSGETLVEALDYHTMPKPAPVTFDSNGNQVKGKPTQEQQPNIRSIVMYDEFDTLLSKMNIMNSTLEPKINTLYNSDGGSVTARTRGKPAITVEDYFVNMFVGFQDDLVSKFISPERIRSGHFSRYCFALGQTIDIDRSNKTKIDYVAEMSPYVDQLIAWRDDRIKKRAREYNFTAAAEEMAYDFIDETIKPFIKDMENSLLRSLLLRSETMFIKFCMFYGVSAYEDLISEYSVSLAKTHWQWWVNQTELIFDNMSGITQEVIDFIESIVIHEAQKKAADGDPEFITHGRLRTRVLRKYKGSITDDGLDRIILSMLRGGMIHKIDRNRGKIGRPKSERYAPNG